MNNGEYTKYIYRMCYILCGNSWNIRDLNDFVIIQVLHKNNLINVVLEFFPIYCTQKALRKSRIMSSLKSQRCYPKFCSNKIQFQIRVCKGNLIYYKFPFERSKRIFQMQLNQLNRT